MKFPVMGIEEPARENQTGLRSHIVHHPEKKGKMKSTGPQKLQMQLVDHLERKIITKKMQDTSIACSYLDTINISNNYWLENKDYTSQNDIVTLAPHQRDKEKNVPKMLMFIKYR